MPTKDELLLELEELEKEKATLEQENRQLSTQLRAEIEGKEGWLITTPNAGYDGELYGVQFVNGQAFIPKTRVFPRFQVSPAKKATLIKRGFDEETIAEIREREQRPTAKTAVEKFTGDFDYEAQFYDADHQDELKAKLDQRASERARMRQMQESKGDKAFLPLGV